MYCPSCGAESSRSLKYCSRCGASTGPETELVPISLTKPALVIGLTTASITLGGFALLITGAVKLAEVFKVPDPIMAVIMFGMVTILVSDIMLIRLLGRIVNASLEAKKERPVSFPQPLGQETPKQLNPQYEPVPSVTEHTTRTFTPVLREPVDRSAK
jgi:uncharacterized OB-fold protein